MPGIAMGGFRAEESGMGTMRKKKEALRGVSNGWAILILNACDHCLMNSPGVSLRGPDARGISILPVSLKRRLNAESYY
jgi:hypothetical protein